MGGVERKGRNTLNQILPRRTLLQPLLQTIRSSLALEFVCCCLESSVCLGRSQLSSAPHRIPPSFLPSFSIEKTWLESFGYGRGGEEDIRCSIRIE